MVQTTSRSPRAVLRTQRKILPAVVAATLACQVQAVEFELGEIQGRFDTQLSVGASWRVESRDNRLVSVPNGGTSAGSGSYDDGNQNFENGETFSKVLKGVSELSLEYENVGALIRGKYWTDLELENENRAHGNVVNGYAANSPLSDRGFNDYAKFSGAEILDAYVYGYFDIGDKPVDIRLGRQVLNWGESTFIQGGLNSINAVDVNTFRRPGAEVKEGLLPASSIFGSIGLTDNLSVEGFYQLQWEPTVADGCGTYFSANDFASEGCDGIRIVSSSLPATSLFGDNLYFNSPLPAVTDAGLRQSLSAGLAAAGQPQAVIDAALGSIPSFNPVVLSNAVVNRHSDGRREPDDQGQFGLAARYFAEDLNNTEFGFYFSRYHSRLPVISGLKTANNPLATVPNADLLAAKPSLDAADAIRQQAAGTTFNQLHGLTQALNSQYFIEYPEDINMIGVSFNTNVGEVALSGEVSHRQDVPIQINGPSLVASMLTLGTQAGNPVNGRVASAAFGGYIQGWDKFDITQVQTTAIKTFNNVAGASRLALVGELGWTHIHNFDDSSDAIKYGRSGAFGYSPSDTKGFVTQNSVGYVARAALEYPNAFQGVTLTPQISFKHGISGNGPEPGAVFREGEKSLNLALRASYQETYQAELSFTSFFGGSYNALEDRDFVSLSASVSF